MEKPCFPATSHMNISSNLLDDVEEPSLSSLDESVASSKDVSIAREDSYSDGEAMRSVMSSTPQKRNEQRRSVSLVDVSKIDAFTSRPLGNMLASWETIGSQSSVGKSRDSGYIHSGSLLSINSAKLSEVKESSDHMGVILEERNCLKRELEYNEVLINTLQESNNDLRMKYAAAQNRISELRLKCVKHCDCCSQTYTKSNPQQSSLSQSVFVESSDSSSSSESSRSPSPPPPRSKSCRLFNPKSKTFHSPMAKPEDLTKSEEDSCSDVSAESTSRVWPVVRNLTAPASSNTFDQRKPLTNDFHHNRCRRKQAVEKPLENQTRNFNLIRSQTAECSSFKDFESGLYSEKQVSKMFEPPLNLVSKTDSFSETRVKPNCKPSVVPSTSNGVKEEIHLKKEGLASSQFHSVEDLLASIVKEKEAELEDDKPVFVANEVNGKICVGNFRVWQNSIRVSPKSPFITSPMVTVRNSSPSFDRLNLTQEAQEVNIPLKNNVNLRVSVKQSPGCSSRPVSVNSSFANSSNISSKRNMSLSNHSLNYKDNEGRPRSQNDYTSCSLKQNSFVNEIPSTFNSSQNPQDLTPKRSSSAVFHTTRNNESKSYDSNIRINNAYRRSNTSAGLTASNSKSSPNRENMSYNESLGVTITKKERQPLCSDSWMNKLKSFKLDKVPFSFLLQSDSSEKVDSGAESSKPLLTSKDNSYSPSSEVEPQVSYRDSLPHSKLENTSSHYSEDLQDCQGMADELSRRLAQLCDHLKYTQHIGKA